MPALSPDAQAVVRAQRLGFVATVNADGTPNLSPKGTLTVLDEDHLVFADLDSPGTVANLRRDPRIEACVVDPIRRTGYRFRGTARVIDGGAELEHIRRRYAEGPLRVREEAGSAIRAAVIIEVGEEIHTRSPAVRSEAGDVRRGARGPERRLRWAWRAVHLGAVKGGGRDATGSGLGGLVALMLAVPGLMYWFFDSVLSGRRLLPTGRQIAVALLAATAITAIALVVGRRWRRSRPSPPTGFGDSSASAGRPDDEVLRDVRLVHVATIDDDGRPRVAQIGTAIPWGKGLAFVLSAASGTAANLRRRPAVHANVVDPLVRKGYRYRGAATVHDSGPGLDAVRGALGAEPSHVRAEAPGGAVSAVVLESPDTRPLISPGYGRGTTEAQMRREWLEHYRSLESPVSGATVARFFAAGAALGLLAGIALFLGLRDALARWYDGLPWVLLGALFGTSVFGGIPLAIVANRRKPR